MFYFKEWITNIPKQLQTHSNADFPLEQYLSYYEDKFKKVTIGCSFAPDLIEQMYANENRIKDLNIEKKLETLKILIHDFGMRDIRLGVKWNKVVTEKGELDFSYYHPYLEYCLTHQVNVCLNVGPIKTFGWPEEYVPKQILENVNDSESVITLDTKLATYALKYLDQLLKHIQASYTKEQLRYITIIQPENEAFNVYGKHNYILEQNYIYEVIKRIVAVFPHKKILLSSSETRDIRPIVGLIKTVIKDSFLPGERFVVGINYYYNLPRFVKVPKLGPIDTLTVSTFLQNTTPQYTKDKSRQYGYAVEVTEAQFEQWGRAYLSPGNSHHEAKYLFARIVDNILDPESGGLIRLWGFERYAKKKLEGQLSDGHKMNLKLITQINNL